MIDEGVTWIVAADGSQAKVFQESRRGGPVRELADQAMEIEGADRPAGRSHAATVHQRVGPGRHAGKEEAPAQEAEARFLRRVAERLDAGARRGDFDRLVIMAPPKALGELRSRLTPLLAARLAATEPHNRTGDHAEAIRAHLRKVRASA